MMLDKKLYLNIKDIFSQYFITNSWFYNYYLRSFYRVAVPNLLNNSDLDATLAYKTYKLPNKQI